MPHSTCHVCGDPLAPVSVLCRTCLSPAIHSVGADGPTDIIGPVRTLDSSKAACPAAISPLSSGPRFISPRRLRMGERTLLLSSNAVGDRRSRRRRALRAAAWTIAYHLLLLAVSALIVIEYVVPPKPDGLVVIRAANVLPLDSMSETEEPEDFDYPELDTLRHVEPIEAPELEQEQEFVTETHATEAFDTEKQAPKPIGDSSTLRPPPWRRLTALRPLKPRQEAPAQVYDAGRDNDIPERYRNRFGTARDQALDDFGGSAETAAAVEAALVFLQRYQLDDGSWDPTGAKYKGSGNPLLDDAGTALGADVGITSLAVLCYLGAGYTADEGKYKTTVRNALKWLMDSQDNRGGFGPSKGFLHIYNYNSAVATLALSEACVLHDNKAYRRSAKRGVRYFVRSQNRTGGWTYTSAVTSTGRGNPRTDASISGWVVLALSAAEEAGIKVSQRVKRRLIKAYAALTVEDTGETIYADRDLGKGRRGIGMVGVGLTARRLLDPKRFAEVDRKAMELLVNDAPDWEKLTDESNGFEPNFHTMYGWYYGTLGMFLASGGKNEQWSKWNEEMKQALIDHQDGAGDKAGSWAPIETWLGRWYGRLYSTTLACLSLETYYRYAPGAEQVIGNAPVTTGRKTRREQISSK